MTQTPGTAAAGNTQDAFFPRRTAAHLPTIVSGRGALLTDDRGRELIDVCSGTFLADLGQGNERVLSAIVEQGRRLTYTYSRVTRHPANAELTGRLAALTGPGLDCVHLTSGGSEANEMAVKMLRARAVARGEPERTRVVTLLPSYHGATVYTLGLTGDLAATGLWEPLTVGAEHVPAPLTFRAPSPEAAAAATIAALGDVLRRVGAERVLAVLVEPIGGQSSGVNVPHPSFARALRGVCDEHGIALVHDEVVTAFRTGAVLASHHDPAAGPDMVTLAKGLGSGYVPLGAVVTSRALADELADSIGFTVSHSYDANPVACAAGTAVLGEIADRGLVERAAVLGGDLRRGLDELAARHPLVGDVRGRGLLHAVELVADPDTNARFPPEVDPAALLVRAGYDRGLLLYARRQNHGRFGDWLLVTPPLVVDRELVTGIVERLDDLLHEVAPQLLASRRA